MFFLFAVLQQEKVHFAENTMIRQAVRAVHYGTTVNHLKASGSRGYAQALVDDETVLSSDPPPSGAAPTPHP